MKKLLLPALLAATLQAPAQTLFTIGTDSVSVPEFLYAYRKNNTTAHSAKAINDYLQLYIASKLKVKEARSRGYDTAAQFRAELENLRSQVMPTYLNDPQGVRQLAEEAFGRMQNDRKLAHIFVSLTNAGGERDTAAAFRKITEAYNQLRSGKLFTAVAQQYSEDPAAASNGGSLGYITPFQLPYELETLAYNTPVGGISPIHRSAAGYHILKVDGERKAWGKISVAQVLLAFAPGATAAEKAVLRKRADSLYTALQKGASFAAVAEQWSNDVVSAGAGGRMPDFGVGQYSPVFEAKAFGLAKDGAITPPFETEHGIHILKRLKKMPAPTELTATVLQDLRERVQQSDRIAASRRQLMGKVLVQGGYQPLPATMQAALERHTQKLIQNALGADAISGNTVLFRLGTQDFTVAQWEQHARNFHVKEDGSGEKPFEQLWNEFLETQAMEYYSRNLEAYSPEFRSQMTEFSEGNLFFEIMQREIWTPAQADTAGLRRFYEANKENYRWSRSADAAVFYVSDSATARKLAAQVQKAPAQWRRLAEIHAETVTIDSARFEWSSLPGIGSLPFRKGVVTKVQASEADGSASFALVLQVYAQPVQRSFEEARGVVINDYQAQKEKEWLQSLRSKYPVQVDDAVLRTLERQQL